MIDRYTQLVKEVQQNVAFAEKYGVPYDPPTIGYSRTPEKGSVARLAEISQEVDACRKCSLGKERCSRGRKAVPGGGNPYAQVMIVGEGPGRDEEQPHASDPRYGFPFVGVSGAELDRILNFLGLKREEVFITNVVKCRATELKKFPGSFKVDNRKPVYTEVMACLPYLEEQINLVKPYLILTFGGLAACALLNKSLDTPLTQFKDKLHDYPKDSRIKVWPTWHPAYLLRATEEKMSTSLWLKHPLAMLKKLREGESQ